MGKEIKQNQCCVCGKLSCEEATDHRKISITEVQNLIKGAKKPNSQLDELKRRVTGYYQQVKEELLDSLTRDEKVVHEQLNRFYFQHLNSAQINISFLCQLLQKNYQYLPNRRLAKLEHYLRNTSPLNPEEDSFDDLNLKNIQESIIRHLEETSKTYYSKKVLQELINKKIMTTKLPKLQLKKSISTQTVPEEPDDSIFQEFSWKNSRITKKNKTLALNNKKISDIDLMMKISSIGGFKNLQELEIRNNKITVLSCKVIASHLGFLKILDLRGNGIGDEGVIKIVQGMPNLKSLMVSETGMTDVSAKVLVQGMEVLETLWCQHNKISDQLAVKLGEKPKLRIMSLVGNGISQECTQLLQKIFNSKGYVAT